MAETNIPKSKQTCQVEGCEGNNIARGYCSKHYQQMRKNGMPLLPRKYGTICGVNGCGSKHLAKGYCLRHYAQITRHGKILEDGPHPIRLCQVFTCNKKHYAKGYCHTHYMQIKRYGKIRKRTKFTPNEIISDGNICRVSLYDIKTNKVAETIIDAADKKHVARKKWNLDAFGYVGSGHPRIWLSRYIMGNVPAMLDVDHIDGDKLNNRKSNLRLATRSQNLANKRCVLSKSGLKGVSWDKGKRKWASKISKDYNSIHIGHFNNKFDAAIAYDKKAVELFGEFAATNKELGLL